MPRPLTTIESTGTVIRIRRLWPVVGAAAILACVGFLQLNTKWEGPIYGFWLHTLVELACVGTALGAFLVGWGLGFRQTLRGLALSASFLIVGSLNLLHLVCRPEMPDFITPNSLPKALLFGCSARLVLALAFYGATFLPIGRINRLQWRLFPAAACLVTVAFSLCILKCETNMAPMGLEPDVPAWVYIFASGITSGLLFGTYIWLQSNFGRRASPTYLYGANAVGFLMIGEIAFALNKSVGDLYHLIGHIYKLIAYHLIFKCLLKSSLGRLKELNVRLQKRVHGMRRLESLGKQLPLLAHELKNPLSAIRASAQLYALLDEPEQRIQVMKRIKSEVDHLTNLIEVTVESMWSRWSTNRTNLNVRDIIFEVVSAQELELLRAHIDVELHIAQQLPDVKAHRGLLGQALTNVVINAIEAMPEGGRLIVEADQPIEGFILIKIYDSGAGIPLEIRRNIFDEFVTTKTQKAGLGLAVADQIITDLHGGKIYFETAAGMGTTFFIRLPTA